MELRQVDAFKQKDNLDPSMLPGKYLLLEINDTGHGMDTKTLSKTFEPYFTTKEMGKGTGLGLSMVLGIIEEHNGYIKTNSKPGKGTKISVYLPISCYKADSCILKEKEEILIGGKERILLIDDDQDILDAIKEFLKEFGYKVECFSDAAQALPQFIKNPYQFDLVITDMTMPQMSGSEFSNRVLKIRNDIPIILCTGYSESISEIKALEIGIKKFMQKPIDTKSLLILIRKVLDEK